MPSTTDKSREQRLSEESQFFQSPWSDDTQKLRNQILLVSLIGILMAAVGIVPKEITAFGLKVNDISPRALLLSWAGIDAYLVVTLAFHAYSDFMLTYWRELNKIELRGLSIEIEPAPGNLSNTLDDEVFKVRARLRHLHEVRLLVDLLVPIVFGIIAFFWLLCRAYVL